MSDEPETIPAESPPEPKQKTVKKKKKPEKPEWNRYIWHLTDKRRDKLMELPVIPKSVKQTNKELLKKQRSRSAISEKDSKSVIKFDTTSKEASKRKETTSKLLKSIIKNSDSTSSSRSHSRAKSYKIWTHNYNYVLKHNKLAEINKGFKLSMNNFCDRVSSLLSLMFFSGFSCNTFFLSD